MAYSTRRFGWSWRDNYNDYWWVFSYWRCIARTILWPYPTSTCSITWWFIRYDPQIVYICIPKCRWIRKVPCPIGDINESHFGIAAAVPWNRDNYYWWTNKNYKFTDRSKSGQLSITLMMCIAKLGTFSANCTQKASKTKQRNDKTYVCNFLFP